MKNYNSNNYRRYKEDLKSSLPDDKNWDEYTRDELIVKFMPLENLARKFSTTQQASGVMTITDMIQEGVIGLIKAVDKIIWETINEAEDPEKRLKSFLAKRVKGAIRRAIDNNRGTMRIPEESLGTDEMVYEIPEIEDEPNNKDLNELLMKLLKKHLDTREYDVIRMSYGLDCEKKSASEIASHLNINGTSSYVRVSQLKRQAIQKLKNAIGHSQVIDLL